MADWFEAMFSQVVDELLADPKVTAGLERTDRTSIADLRSAANGSLDDHRLSLAKELAEVEGVREEQRRAERNLLDTEWRAVLEATKAQDEARQGPAEPSPRRSKVLTMLVRAFALIFRRGRRPAELRPDPVARARAAADEAVSAYGRARVTKNVDSDRAMLELKARLDRLQAALREQLKTGSLYNFIRGRIDDGVKASYSTTFSYVGPACIDLPLSANLQPVDTQPHRDLRDLIQRRVSGTIGVSGPRGSGKSTLLERFATTATIDGQRTRWGVCVSAPTAYEARDFVLYLFERLCVEVLGSDRARAAEESFFGVDHSAQPRPLPSMRYMQLVICTALAIAGVLLLIRSAFSWNNSPRSTDLLVAAGAMVLAGIGVLGGAIPSPFPRYRYRMIPQGVIRRTVVYAIVFLLALGLIILVEVGGIVPDVQMVIGSVLLLAALIFGTVALAPRRGVSHWHDEPYEESSLALDWYRKIRFQQTYTSGWSGTVTLGYAKLPVSAQGGRTRSWATAAVPLSLPEIVAGFKDFVTSISIDPSIPVVIAIDEVDKMLEAGVAQKFLNSIKGIFGASNSLLLISISDDAMISFERRGMPIRDAFDSSLSSVIHVPYLKAEESNKLVGGRLVALPEPFKDLLFVLSGGLARDLVRTIREAVEVNDRGTDQLVALASAMIGSEINRKKKAVMVGAVQLKPSPATDALVSWAASTLGSSPPADALLRDSLMLSQACATPALRPSTPVAVPANGDAAEPSPERAAQEMAAFCAWAATVLEVFGTCTAEEGFLAGEDRDSPRCFARLVQARQAFSFGPTFVLRRVDEIRDAWRLGHRDAAVAPEGQTAAAPEVAKMAPLGAVAK